MVDETTKRRLCRDKLRADKKKASEDYWQAKAEDAGVEYIKGEPPQNLRKRIADAKDKPEVEVTVEIIEDKLVTLKDEIRELEELLQEIN